VIPPEQLSEEVKLTLNKDTQEIIATCLKEVEKTLSEKRDILERFAQELVKREELEYDEIMAIFAEYGYKEQPSEYPGAPASDKYWDEKK